MDSTNVFALYTLLECFLITFNLDKEDPVPIEKVKRTGKMMENLKKQFFLDAGLYLYPSIAFMECLPVSYLVILILMYYHKCSTETL